MVYSCDVPSGLVDLEGRGFTRFRIKRALGFGVRGSGGVKGVAFRAAGL